jgi:ABC-type transport system involved in cytochrome c biogenesis permease component
MGITVIFLIVLTIFIYALYLEEVIAFNSPKTEILKSILLPTIVISIAIPFFLYGTYATSLTSGNAHIWNLKYIVEIIAGSSVFWCFAAMITLGRSATQRLKVKYALSDGELKKGLNIMNYKRRFREWERKRTDK